MKCSRCNIKTARIAIIDEDGYYTDDCLFCCECFIIDVQEKIKLAKERKGTEQYN